MPTDFEATFLPEVNVTGPCMTCLREKAADGDIEAAKVIKLLKVIAEYLACKFLTADSSEPCSGRSVKPIPSEIQRLLSGTGYFSGTRFDLVIGGLIHRVLEDEDWDQP